MPTAKPMWLETYEKSRYVSNPLDCIETIAPDEVTGSTALLSARLPLKNGKSQLAPVVQWDAAQGLTVVGDNAEDRSDEEKQMYTVSEAELKRITQGIDSRDPIAAFTRANTMLNWSTLYIHNADKIVPDYRISQALENMKNPNKERGRCAVLLTPGVRLPANLAPHVLMIDHPLPSREELREIVLLEIEQNNIARQKKNAKLAKGTQALALYTPDNSTIELSIDALRGLDGGTAGLTVAMNIGPDGLFVPGLWDRKCQQISGYKGLGIVQQKDKFEDVIGMSNLKRAYLACIMGRIPIGGIVLMDEFADALAGVGSDLSGVTTELHGRFLKWLSSNKILAVLIVGAAGVGKTYLAECLGPEVGKPVIDFDISATKGGIVGESIANLSAATKVVMAVTDNRPLIVATCNDESAISPQLRSRFAMKFFADVPDDAAKLKMFMAKLTKREMDLDQKLPDFSMWNPREIEQCVDLAYRFNSTVEDAASFVVPTMLNYDALEVLRKRANGLYTSVEDPGPYQRPNSSTNAGGRRRNITVGDPDNN